MWGRRKRQRFISLGTAKDIRIEKAKLRDELIEARPIIALALTTTVQVFENRLDDSKLKFSKTVQIAIDTEVIEITTQFSIEHFEKVRQKEMAVGLDPKIEALNRFSQVLSSRPLVEMRFTSPI